MYASPCAPRHAHPILRSVTESEFSPTLSPLLSTISYNVFFLTGLFFICPPAFFHNSILETRVDVTNPPVLRFEENSTLTVVMSSPLKHFLIFLLCSFIYSFIFTLRKDTGWLTSGKVHMCHGPSVRPAVTNSIIEMKHENADKGALKPNEDWTKNTVKIWASKTELCLTKWIVLSVWGEEER